MELFIPGRLCILGEHTDWASGKHKVGNPEIPNGYCIVCATNEGLHATVNDYSNGILRYEHRDAAGKIESFEISMLDPSKLAEEAAKGKFFSYIFGTASHMLRLPQMSMYKTRRGIFINNHTTTLPMKKGLSSSAAICTIVATAFNEFYALNLSRDEIMDCAFNGEILTGVQCGRMDQAVAMGAGKIGLMSFSGNSCELLELTVGKPLYFVVVDLLRGKNTSKILADLNAAFPYPKTNAHKLLHDYVRNNVALAETAKHAIEFGDSRLLSKCMTEAQSKFDECAIVNSPEELTSPKLHEVMHSERLRRVSLAIKGVGSQGDGSAQVLCADEIAQRAALDILVNELECEGFLLTIPATV